MASPLTSQALTTLRDALATHFLGGLGRTDPVGRELDLIRDGLVDLADLPPQVPPPSDHAAITHLGAALAGLAPGALSQALVPVADNLPWRYGYAPRSDAPGLHQSMAWAEVVGPVAPFVSQRICLGLTLIGPHSHYLDHLHPAVELYQVISGTAQWSAAGQAAPRPPGSYILHPSNCVHAMKTGDQPLLAIYSWSGDIVTPSRWAP